MTWRPSAIAKGRVSSPHAPCNVRLIGELGLLELHLDGAKPADVPVGQWRVLSYMIQIKDWKAPPKEKEDKEKKEQNKDAAGKKSLLGALASSLLGSTSAPSRGEWDRMSMVAASGTTKGELAVVEAGKMTELKFGPPYKLAVQVAPMPGFAHLSLQIQGRDAENVDYLLVNGQRPEKPKLTITDPAGKVVVEGDFEYG